MKITNFCHYNVITLTCLITNFSSDFAIDCLREQWQALEGLAGVAFSCNSLRKAKRYYEEACGICAAGGSKIRRPHEQERLLRKLATFCRMLQTSVTIHHYIIVV